MQTEALKTVIKLSYQCAVVRIRVFCSQLNSSVKLAKSIAKVLNEIQLKLSIAMVFLFSFFLFLSLSLFVFGLPNSMLPCVLIVVLA